MKTAKLGWAGAGQEQGKSRAESGARQEQEQEQEHVRNRAGAELSRAEDIRNIAGAEQELGRSGVGAWEDQGKTTVGVRYHVSVHVRF